MSITLFEHVLLTFYKRIIWH